MITSVSKRTITDRLFNENICTKPLDERSLEIIEEYMRYNRSGSDLCRRLSDIELNYVQISSEADAACISVSESKDRILSALRDLTDSWRTSGYLHEFIFKPRDDDMAAIRFSYANALETVRAELKNITDCLLTISETAAQIRACAASFSEVYKESKLAVYAGTLNRDVESVLDCRSTSLQAHASVSECEKASANLLGIARVCTGIITRLNSMILETSDLLNPNGLEQSINNKFSAANVNNIICRVITSLDNLNFTI